MSNLKGIIYENERHVEIAGLASRVQVGSWTMSEKDYLALKQAMYNAVKKSGRLSVMNNFQRWFNIPYEVSQLACMDLIESGAFDYFEENKIVRIDSDNWGFTPSVKEYSENKRITDILERFEKWA
jgi:hypothetical protein